MSLRTLLNAAYAYLARNAASDNGQEGLDALDAELEAEPRAGGPSRPETRGRSRGVGKLMASLGMPAPPPRPKATG